MKKRTLLLSITLGATLLAFQTTDIKAQMVGLNAFLKGTGVEIGIDGGGGFEGAPDTTTVPAGMHFRSNNPYFGFNANPQADAWATFDGDFFTPGSPENGWGYEIGTAGTTKSNNCASFSSHEIPGAITAWSHIGTTYTMDWEADDTTGGNNLHFRINYLLEETDLFYTTTITVTNNAATPVTDFYYYRNLDPDNNIMLSGDYTTQNTILMQPACCSYAMVGATQSLPWNSYFAFLTEADTNWRASYGGFSNRDASDLWNGVGFVQTVGATNFADEAIAISYIIPNLLPGGSETFKYCSLFNSGSIVCAQGALALNINTIANVCTTSAPFALTGGTPAGGTYSGVGVTGGNMFDPSLTGAGAQHVLYSYTDVNSCANSVSQIVQVEVCSGVNNLTTNNTVSIYPNPITDNASLTISNEIVLKGAELLMYDVTGKQVMLISDINTNEIKIARNDLANGVYFFKVFNDAKEVASGKLLYK